jgi:hypothetical protein
MAFTTVQNRITFTYRDVRGDKRNRVIETGGVNLFTDDDAILHDLVSKSAVIAYQATNKQVDMENVGDADSEVKDTLRLYFLMPDATIGHYDIVDPHDILFLSDTGEGANILRSQAQLTAVGLVPGVSLVAIIAQILAGDILISDGETPVEFLEGARL